LGHSGNRAFKVAIDPKKDVALMATISYWKTLKTVENLGEKTSLKNPWKTNLSKYGKLFFEL
jgi:hypothetical protein